MKLPEHFGSLPGWRWSISALCLKWGGPSLGWGVPGGEAGEGFGSADGGILGCLPRAG